MIIQPVILAGGSGTRLWPLSRDNFPKPFLNIVGSNSLFQETIIRLETLASNHPIVISNQNHKFLIQEQLNSINKSHSSIILEPIQKNTAPALTLAAIHSLSISKNSLLICLPADHLIENTSDFIASLNKGISKAKDGSIVTFGISPTEPKTGYGYIECSNIKADGSELIQFIEKPKKELALSMVNSGNYLWNSGIFMMRAETWISLISQYSPSILENCELAMKNSISEGEVISPDKAYMELCPNISIDYAVMEKINSDINMKFNSWVIPINSGWSDVGTWKEIWNHVNHNKDGNHTLGNIYTEDVTNSILISQSNNLAVIGLSDIAIIQTPDATLVTPFNQDDKLKKLVTSLETQNLEIKKDHNTVKRPWGEYTILEEGSGFQVKKLIINAKNSISLQSHNKRSEHWTVVKGNPLITNGSSKITLTENESIYIPKNAKHRIENPNEEIVVIIEVQIGDYIEEDDIIRYEDQYNRTSED
tara:strand:- start:222 stop:1658 length:1437 start_codon:yes stop_codon:yes gene_type:complete